MVWYRLMFHMMTPSNGNIFRVTGHLCGEFTGHRWIPAQRPVTRSFHVFFELRLNKRLSKQSWGWWFETPSRPLWRHCNGSNTVYRGKYITQIRNNCWYKPNKAKRKKRCADFIPWICLTKYSGWWTILAVVSKSRANIITHVDSKCCHSD